MNNSELTCQTQPAASSANHLRRSTLPVRQALDPASLARQPSNQVRSRAPKPLYPPSDPAITSPPTQPNVKNGPPPLDITRPFMDDELGQALERSRRLLGRPSATQRAELAGGLRELSEAVATALRVLSSDSGAPTSDTVSQEDPDFASDGLNENPADGA